MKAPLLWLAAVILLTSCGSAWKLKRAQRLINSAIENGARVDSLTKIVHDTIHTKSVEKQIQIVKEFDTIRVIEKCKEIVKNASKEKVKDLQKEICPDTSATLSQDLEIVVQGKTFKVPINMSVSSRNGVLMGVLNVKRTEIPFESEKTTVGVSSGYTLWGVILRCAVCSIILAAFVFVLCKLKIL